MRLMTLICGRELVATFDELRLPAEQDRESLWLRQIRIPPHQKDSGTMISQDLERALRNRQIRAHRSENHLEAYPIWGTIGTDLFLTREGKVLMILTNGNLDDAASVEELTNEIEINAPLTAAKCNIPELRELLPDPEENSIDCPECQGIGRKGLFILCETCRSRGWAASP